MNEPTVSASQLTEQPECPLCGHWISAGSPVIECPACKSDYHAECWEFCGNRCGRYGCRGEVVQESATPRRANARRPPVLLRVRPSDIADTLRRVSRGTRRPETSGSPWVSWRGLAVLTPLLGSGAKLLLLAATSAITALLGAQRATASTPLQILNGAVSANWLVWLVAGALYCDLHRRLLKGSTSKLARLCRFLISAPYLCALGFCLGHLLLTPSHLWPTILWGLPRGLLWLSWVLPWIGFTFVLLGVLTDYFSDYDLLLQAYAIMMVGAAVLVGANGSVLVSGLALSALAAGVGWLLDLVFDGYDLAHKLWRYGCIVLGSLAFLAGMGRTVAGISSQIEQRSS